MVPVSVLGISDAVSISVNAESMPNGNAANVCALLDGGSIMCWGDNVMGELGAGLADDYSSTPVAVSGIGDAVAVAVGERHGCAVLADGTGKCWGFNSGAQLGDVGRDVFREPAPLAGLTGAVDVDAGRSHTCALLASGGLRCWGLGLYGSLGKGELGYSLTPAPVVGLGP